MRNPVRPNNPHSRTIAAEIGERLRQTLEVERELPPSLKSLLERLRASEDASRKRRN
ncbi:hypothetical protein ACVWZZ_002348 [Bradyrhizobium sp. LM6.10]|jgi:hypothetical protein